MPKKNAPKHRILLLYTQTWTLRLAKTSKCVTKSTSS